LVDYRDQLVRATTQVANRAHADLLNIRPGYGREVPNLRAKGHRSMAKSLLRGDRSVRAELIRKRLAELSRLEAEVATMDRRIEAMVRDTGTSLTEIPGVGPFIAAKILGEVGDPSRVRSKAAFAVLSGTAPLSASSGQTHRHRLNRGGNHQLNWALHYIALVQCRILPRRGVVEFVRLVRSDRVVRILGARIIVPEHFIHRYLTAILYVRTRRLVVDCQGSRLEIPFVLRP